MPFNKKIAFLGKLDSIKIENVDFLSLLKYKYGIDGL